MSRTGLVAHAAFERHDTGVGHPERSARYAAVLDGLERSGLRAQLDSIEAPLADRTLVERVHEPRYVAHVEASIAAGRRLLDEGDTRVSSASFDAALRAAGGACEAVERVVDGRWRNAFVVARPPGHHAEREHAMGFCVFNSAAIAAVRARDLGIERVAIVDWDVHHGNGTQHLFERDPRVFYASLHQWPLYPGTGARDERGLGDGEGATLNLPQAIGAGDREWLRAFDDELVPALERFAPRLVIVSAGFDAHARDPLAQTQLSTSAFERMTEGLMEIARAHAGGKLVSLLEGGYDLEALAQCAEAHVGRLAR